MTAGRVVAATVASESFFELHVPAEVP